VTPDREFDDVGRVVNIQATKVEEAALAAGKGMVSTSMALTLASFADARDGRTWISASARARPHAGPQIEPRPARWFGCRLRPSCQPWVLFCGVRGRDAGPFP